MEELIYRVTISQIYTFIRKIKNLDGLDSKYFSNPTLKFDNFFVIGYRKRLHDFMTNDG